jgi:hypothetical protein
LLSACQVSALLSWNSIAHTRAREGVTYLALSCQLMSQLQTESATLTVEDQLSLEYLSAVLSLITVWTFSQLDQSSGYLTGTVTTVLQGDQARLFASISQTTSLMLDSYPDYRLDNSEQATSMQDIDFIYLCDHLRQALTATADSKSSSGTQQNSKQVMVGGVREILILSLLVPRTVQDALLFTPRVESLLHRCSLAITVLANLANHSTSLPKTNTNVLNKLTFHRVAPTTEEEGDVAWKSTLASVLFETLAEAVQAVSNVLRVDQGALAHHLLDISQKLLATPMALVIDTPALKQAREKVEMCRNSLQSRTSTAQADDLKWMEEALQPSDNADMPLEWEAIADSDVFGSLWGQLQWDFESNSSLGTSSPANPYQ